MLIVAYLVLFALVGFLFVFASLLIGRFVRPNMPTPEKLEVYECGEPAIGSSFVQFDLRFYVVALLFIIFDVEVAFFFPWATVYGKATALLASEPAKVQAAASPERVAALTPEAALTFRELGVPNPDVPLLAASVEANEAAIEAAANQLALLAIADMAIFFGVLLVGFAYVWYRGDLDWVRSVPTAEEQPEEEPVPQRDVVRVSAPSPVEAG